MINIKSAHEIEIMKEGGEISNYALKRVIEAAKPGVSLLELDQIAEKAILEKGAKPSFKTVDDYSFTTCLNVNEGIVHGLPDNYKIKRGDLLSIDLGALHKGFHSDISYTLEVESNNEEKFLNAGKAALKFAIEHCFVGNHIGDVSSAIQNTIELEGYTVSRDLVGHGIGRELHEDPYVPGYGKPGKGIELKEGMVFAVEVIYQKGKPAITLEEDGWTIRTLDGSLSALFEMTVAITRSQPLLITQY